MRKLTRLIAVILVLIIALTGCAAPAAPAPAAPAQPAAATSGQEAAQPQPAAQPTAASAPAPAASGANVPVLRLAGTDFGFPQPFTYQRGPGYVLTSLLFDTLTWKDSKDVIPWLATEWKPSADGKTWTFTLRDGVKWQDGQPLTADDVVFSYEYYKKQAPGNAVGRGMEFVDSARKVDDSHVEIVLSRPYAPFLMNTAGSYPIIPKHIWEKVADPKKFTSTEAAIGSGPYKLVSYDKSSGAYLFEANPDFWLGQPYVRRIEYVPASDALLALQQGAIDIASLPASAGAEVVAAFDKPEFGKISRGGEGVTIIYFNMAKGAPYSDLKFRQAAAYAIDRNEMVKRMASGRGDPGSMGWLPPASSWQNQVVEQYKFDPAKARTLLDTAGYKDVNGDGVRELPDGKPMNLPLQFDSASGARVTELVRDRLKDIGVAVTLRPVDRTSLDSATSTGNYEMAITNYGGLGGDPDYLRQAFSSKSPAKAFWRVQGYANPRFDELANQQLGTMDPAKRKAMIHEMQSILAQDAVTVPLFYASSTDLYRKDVFDAWYITPAGIASGVPMLYNKQVFVTGQPTGLEIKGQ